MKILGIRFGPQEGWIYFAVAGPFVKIGWALDPPERMSVLRAGCPYPIELVACHPGTRHLESVYRQRFAVQHHWSEWFRFEGDVAAYVWHLQHGGEQMFKDIPEDFEPQYGDSPYWLPPSSEAITV